MNNRGAPCTSLLYAKMLPQSNLSLQIRISYLIQKMQIEPAPDAVEFRLTRPEKGMKQSANRANLSLKDVRGQNLRSGRRL